MIRSKIFVLFFLVLIGVMTSCSPSNDEEANLYSEVLAPAEKGEDSKMEEEIIILVNEYRVSKGLTALEFGNVAYSFAISHNDYMISEGKISHDNFNVRSSNLAVQAKADFVSENVAKDFTTAKGVVKAWINSPAHKKVMEGDFSNTAVSVRSDGNGTLYFTQLFYK